MGCEICGRGNCDRCFHPLDEQEEYDILKEKYGEKGNWHSLRWYRKKEKENDTGKCS